MYLSAAVDSTSATSLLLVRLIWLLFFCSILPRFIMTVSSDLCAYTVTNVTWNVAKYNTLTKYLSNNKLLFFKKNTLETNYSDQNHSNSKWLL